MRFRTTAESGNPRKRVLRRMVVNPHFQWKYASWLIGVVFTASTLLAAIMLYVLREQARATVLGRRIVDSNTDAWLLVGFGAAFATVAAATFGAWSFVLTRRVCGPLARIAGYLAELRAGRFPACAPLRARDEFKDFYREFSLTVDALRDRRRTELAALERVLAELQPDAQARTVGRLDELARELEELRGQAVSGLGESPGDAVTAPSGVATSK